MFWIYVYKGFFPPIICRYVEIFPSRKSEIQVQYGRGRNETSGSTPGPEDTARKMKTGKMFIIVSLFNQALNINAYVVNFVYSHASFMDPVGP